MSVEKIILILIHPKSNMLDNMAREKNGRLILGQSIEQCKSFSTLF
jgi:hypothetical protein